MFSFVRGRLFFNYQSKVGGSNLDEKQKPWNFGLAFFKTTTTEKPQPQRFSVLLLRTTISI